MTNDALLSQFELWMLSTDRLDGTIQLRMRHARELARTVHLRTVSAEQLEAELARRRTLAPETRKSILASWHLLFRWAHRRGIRRDDPTADLPSIRVRQRVPRVAPDDDIEAALLTASTRDRALVMLARYGCLRLTELTTLHTSAREGDRLRIRGKGDKERIVYANEPLLFALHALEREQGPGYYFPGRAGEHMHPMSVNKIITRVTGWNPHSLRHAGATAAYNATGDLRGVQEMLGHASLATTQRYLHLDDDARRRIAEATVIRARVWIAA
ncbi:tyrosine-type recombinase/integrase [Microbacterium immunditiarum]|uniref:Site-specific recombinase XerD n=1 Tax=Microbacterium immunditiarum TaxID=337480 RepID=A0A7Y9GPW0_9MICO|nr:tyrosine-type recombinase/integrase [Microbacterium immunditiarum]NYE20503.1 site-specific recombinase XerD [Microbacterium immunditiarum]